MLHTRICQLLGIEHPIINAPMAATATAQLAAAANVDVITAQGTEAGGRSPTRPKSYNKKPGNRVYAGTIDQCGREPE